MSVIPWVVVYGEGAAQSDLDAADDIFNCLKKDNLVVEIVSDAEFKRRHRRFYNVVSVGGPVTNKVSEEFHLKVTPTLIKRTVDGVESWCMQDSKLNICGCNFLEAGTVGSEIGRASCRERV